MKSHELKIEGMSCGHCVTRVRKALDMVDGLEVEGVEIGKARVWFEDDKVTQDVLAEIIEEAGYKLISVQ